MSETHSQTTDPQPKYVVMYTQEELDAAVADAVKFVNECNARQLLIIVDLQLRLAKLGVPLSEVLTPKDVI